MVTSWESYNTVPVPGKMKEVDQVARHDVIHRFSYSVAASVCRL